MPAVQYPFIDIAVHERVKDRFARGEAIVLFSQDLERVLWANGVGAALFGNPTIYDFLEEGPNRNDVMFRQMETSARQMTSVGEQRSFLVRIASGFQRIAVSAVVETILTQAGETAILFAAPLKANPVGTAQCAQQMLEGFDDPDTHMAVLDNQGRVIAASPGFAALDVTPQTTQALVTMVGNSAERLMKRPIPTGKGFLPAAIGKLSDEPGLHLLFAVETVIGNLDPTEEFRATAAAQAADIIVPAAAAVDTAADMSAPSDTDPDFTPEPHVDLDDDGYTEALDAVAGIEDLDEQPEDETSLDNGTIAPADDAAQGDAAMAHTDRDDDINALRLMDGAEAWDGVSPGEDQPTGIPVTDDEAPQPEPETSVATSEAHTGQQDETVPDDAGDDPEDRAPAESDEFQPTDSHDAFAGDPTADEANYHAASAELPADTAAFEAATGNDTIDDTGSDEPLTPEAEASAAPAAGDPVAEAQPAGFAYRQNSRATRFVWKIDAEGRFSEVSDEFADAVGPHAASINGIAFTDIAHLFNLDPDGKITELLGKRDTWSGKTIYWPIEGTRLKVPVDLAALPTYTRNREFDGFRGFGIVRLADAIDDPLELGLTLAPQPAGDTGHDQAAEAALDASQPAEPFTFPDAQDETVGEFSQAEFEGPTPAVTDDDTSASDAHEAATAFHQTYHETPAAGPVPLEPVSEETTEEPLAGDDALAQADAAGEDDVAPAAGSSSGEAPGDAIDDTEGRPPETPGVTDQPALTLPWGERPALRLVENQNRRYSDKIIQLEDRRTRGREGLSPVEQAAFREIARQLDPFGERLSTDTGKSFDAVDTEDLPVVPHDVDQALQDMPDHQAEVAENEDQPAPDEAASDVERAGEDDAAAETDQDQPDEVESAAAAEADHGDEAEADGDADPMNVLAGLIPPRAKMADGLSPAIVDQMPVALLVHAGDSLIHANPEFLRMTGYETLEELEDVGGLDALLQREELENTAQQSGGIMLVRADDELVAVTARLQSIRWDQSNALMLALIPQHGAASPAHRDREMADTAFEAEPEQKQDRLVEKLAKLQGELEETRSILETATDGVVIIGQDGEIRSMNRSASALFNYNQEETQGKPFVMLFAHESQKAVLDYLNGLAGHGVASILNDGREVIAREASGGFIPLFMTMGSLTVSNGYCAVIRDITQWKRTEEELRSAKRAAETANAHKSDFLARVSHEIRTPLNAIIGFSEMMASERFGPIGNPRYVEYANDIGRSGRHVLDIVNDLLDISKIEAGEMDLEFEAVGLNESISEAVALVQPQANSQRVIIRTSLSHSVPNVVADLRSIKQIALNILSNAIRFTPSGGQIVVSTSYETNGSVVLRIRDTGVGMTRTELEQAMKPFRQVTTGSRKRGDGTGLGLPLTKAMVDANRASFSINSAPNEGTLVEITFPSPRVLAN